jgi:hypothetical protein
VFFATLTRRRLKRGVFRSVDELKAAINRFFAKTNANPKPLISAAQRLSSNNDGATIARE